MRRPGLLALSFGMFSVMPLSSGFAPPQYHPIVGGGGGSTFSRTCGSGKVLTGIWFKEGSLVDAVGVLCRPVSSSGALGAQTTVGSQAGGGGGTSGTASCDAGMVVSRVRIKHGTYVDGIHIQCQKWNASTRKFEGTILYVVSSAGTENALVALTIQVCELATQPVNGFRGRASSLVDAIGTICNEP